MDFNASDLLHRHFGFVEFRSGQREVIDALQTQRAALAVFPTGGGKSLCYQLPALAFEGVTLVVSPLIALMKDQIDFLQSRGIAAARLDSSLSADEAREVSDRLRSGDLKLLYVAPERFNNERFVANLRRTRIALFAVDEAHCISEWGHNFRPDYLKLAATARDLGVERVLALTATATPKVVEEICAGFDIPRECAVVTGFYRPNLNLCTTPVAASERDALLLKRLQSRKPGPTIVYVTLQKTAERVAADLADAGFPARPYHAGMESLERTEVQEWWMAADSHIVVATIAFGMGIDKANVRYVYHYNLPKGLESYSQEIGRAGRDGARSTVELFACPDDVPTLQNFAYGDTPTPYALSGLIHELLESGDEFDVSLTDLSNRHDLRLLVLRTALTYLELMGVLRQGTPFYAGYEIRLLVPLDEILAQFKGEPARFVAQLFEHAKKGRTWYGLNPDDAAAALGQERRRVVRALEYLEEHGWVELRASDVRQRYTRLRPQDDAETLADELLRRFLWREEQEIARIQQVLELVAHDGCQTNALVGYFGEERAAPCGHCTFCVTGQRQHLPPLRTLPPLPADLDVDELKELRRAHPDALGESRQVARFLCGLSSPALTKAKLPRHALFGALEERHFAEVLAWCMNADS
ncbi:MAG: RecQ family ATP-dependent DNA helicase [Armatimonadota bacterium]|nr:RecQ family ATP-dependent DNA helicase [Armatimonadota bacterium]